LSTLTSVWRRPVGVGTAPIGGAGGNAENAVVRTEL
jgi:hypothetical protein